MKFAVTEATFNKPLPSIGSGAWYMVANGKYSKAEYDTDQGVLTLFPNESSPTLKKRRIPAANIADMVWGNPIAADKAVPSGVNVSIKPDRSEKRDAF